MEQTTVVFEEVARLADAELIVGLQRWVRADRLLTARLLVHLGEVDARGLYRERAWPSMFAYAVEEPDVPNRIRKLPLPVSTPAVSIPVATQREVNAASTPICAVTAQSEGPAGAC